MANLSVKVRQDLQLSPRHNVSFGHLSFLSGYRVKKSLEIRVCENEATSRGVTFNFELTLHYLVERNFWSSPLFPAWKNRENEKIYTRYGQISRHQHQYLGVQYALEKDEMWSKWVLCMPTSGTLPRPSQPEHQWKAHSNLWQYRWEYSWLLPWLKMVQPVLPNSRPAFQKWARLPTSKKGILYSILQDESHTFLSTIQILIGITFYNFQRTRTCSPVEQTNVGCTTSPTNQMNS